MRTADVSRRRRRLPYLDPKVYTLAPRRPQLSSCDQERLFAAVRAGVAASATLARLRGEPHEEVAELNGRVVAGRRARNELLEHHHRLVVRLADRFEPDDHEVQDLIQEGCLGLMQAITRFEPAKGFAFSTYAAFWVIRAMAVWMSRYRTHFTLPADAYSTLRAVDATIGRLQHASGAAPSLPVVAAELGILPARLERLLAASRPGVSLDGSASPDGDMPLHDRLPGDDDVETQVIQRTSGDRVSVLLAILGEREREVMEARVGLAGAHVPSFRELARSIGGSRQNAAQIYSRACAKLSHPSVVRHLLAEPGRAGEL